MSSPLAILNYPVYALLGLASLTVASSLIHQWSLTTFVYFFALIMVLPIVLSIGAAGVSWLLVNRLFGRYEFHGTPMAYRQDIQAWRTKQLIVTISWALGFITGSLIDVYLLIRS
jgi:hypothetical protein